MNYEYEYSKIILNAQIRKEIENYEIHHILPISEGGRNNKLNKVKLTYREHHICHLLLIKMGSCKRYFFSNISSREYCKLKTREKSNFNH